MTNLHQHAWPTPFQTHPSIRDSSTQTAFPCCSWRVDLVLLGVTIWNFHATTPAAIVILVIPCCLWLTIDRGVKLNYTWGQNPKNCVDPAQSQSLSEHLNEVIRLTTKLHLSHVLCSKLESALSIFWILDLHMSLKSDFPSFSHGTCIHVLAHGLPTYTCPSSYRSALPKRKGAKTWLCNPTTAFLQQGLHCGVFPQQSLKVIHLIQMLEGGWFLFFAPQKNPEKTAITLDFKHASTGKVQTSVNPYFQIFSADGTSHKSNLKPITFSHRALTQMCFPVFSVNKTE